MAEAAPPAETADPPPPSALELLGQAAASVPGISGFRIESGELVVSAARDSLPSVMTTLRDDPRFSFEQMMDLCGVDWPERAERFDVVYNLLSVTLNQRVRAEVTAVIDPKRKSECADSAPESSRWRRPSNRQTSVLGLAVSCWT